MEEINRVQKPDPATDGLNPFILNRLRINRKRIEEAGYKIRFSVSRGHLNIAAYLLGTTELMTGMLTHPDQVHTLLRIITDYLKEWHDLQRETISSIDGIMILDDMVGFMGEDQFKEFGLPYLKELYDKDVQVKLFHNDAQCQSSVRYYPEIGINIFNMAFDTSIDELKEITEHKITMLGNIPPRDVLAQGTPDLVKNAVTSLISSLKDRSRIIISCGGGMPPGVLTENINAFIQAVKESGTP
jgi:uroporphyrinogen decarboxylase